MQDLIQEKGILFPILKRVQIDNTLMFAIRDDYFNIYYRGGNLLRVTKTKGSNYLAEFDYNYNETGIALPRPPNNISDQKDANEWVLAFPHFKEVMDFYITHWGKSEREFQQLIVRENNYSAISNISDYFISDIEFADHGLRFDLLAVRWLASKRKNGANSSVTFLEMKYGDRALNNSAGLLKHLHDFDNYISDPVKYANLLITVQSQFNQLSELGLLSYRRNSKGGFVKLSNEDKPEVILIIANHNPRSEKLINIMKSPDFKQYQKSPNFNLRFYISTYAGYGIFKENIREELIL